MPPAALCSDLSASGRSTIIPQSFLFPRFPDGRLRLGRCLLFSASWARHKSQTQTQTHRPTHTDTHTPHREPHGLGSSWGLGGRRERGRREDRVGSSTNPPTPSSVNGTGLGQPQGRDPPSQPRRVLPPRVAPAKASFSSWCALAAPSCPLPLRGSRGPATASRSRLQHSASLWPSELASRGRV